MMNLCTEWYVTIIMIHDSQSSLITWICMDLVESQNNTAFTGVPVQSFFYFCYFFVYQNQVEEIKKLKIGDPLDRSTDHGPQNHKLV